MLGTITNAGAVIAGSSIGLLIHSKLPERIIHITFQGVGLFTLVIGVTMAIKTQNFLLMILSIVGGSIVGELINIELHLDRFSSFLKRRLKSKNEKFTEGFITASLLFCTGSLAILGAIEEGLGNPPTLFFAKSVLDGFVSMTLATTFGIGVMCAAVSVFVYQGSLTLLAGLLQNVLTDPVVNELSAVGGLLLLGLGLSVLEVKEIKVLNMLPALLISVILAYFFL